MTSNLLLLPAADIVANMEQAVLGTQTTHASSRAGGSTATLIVDLVESNLRQWDLEDTTRDPHASDTGVANAKREIDHLNIQRHRLIHELDATMDVLLQQSPSAPIATESPGMVLDRLSVLVIRRVRTVAAAARDSAFADRIGVLESQVAALCVALDSFMEELRAGTRRFLLYESFKLYQPVSRESGSAKE